VRRWEVAARRCATGRRRGGVTDSFYLLAWPTFFYGIAWSIVTRKQFEVLRVGGGDEMKCRMERGRSGKWFVRVCYKQPKCPDSPKGPTAWAWKTRQTDRRRLVFKWPKGVPPEDDCFGGTEAGVVGL
jgi:hypothetical protein